MPFEEGGSVESDLVGGRAGSAIPLVSLVVDPDGVLILKQGIEQELGRVLEWLATNGKWLNTVPRPGADPCSAEAAAALSENGEAAMRAAKGYVQQLGKVADELGTIAHAYRLMEDGNTGRFGGGPR